MANDRTGAIGASEAAFIARVCPKLLYPTIYRPSPGEQSSRFFADSDVRDP